MTTVSSKPKILTELKSFEVTLKKVTYRSYNKEMFTKEAISFYSFQIVYLFSTVVETIRRNRFTFTVSGMGSSETLLEAELHLYLSKYEGTHPFEVMYIAIQ